MSRARSEFAEDVAKVEELLERHGAIISDDGIDDPKVEALEDEQVEESLHQSEKNGELDKLWEQIQALETRLSQSDARNDQLQAELDRTTELAKQTAKKQGMDAQWQEFQTAAFMEDEAMKKEFVRIKKEQGSQAVIVIHHHHDPAMNRPIKGSINFRRFEIPRGIPVLVPVAVIQRLYYMRCLRVERYVEGLDGKKFRFIHERRAPFNIMSPGTKASVAVNLR